MRYKTLVHVLGESPSSPSAMAARAEIAREGIAQRLLSERGLDGTIPHHPYSKWRGAHWVLAALADLGYPPGDPSLIPLRDQVYDWLFDEKRLAGIPTINCRTRRCASQEGNALYATLALALEDERTPRLTEWLVGWQWPDGGWNCDRNPDAVHSSYNESLIPVRGLHLYAEITGDPNAREAVDQAAELFLKRKLFRRLSNNRVIKSSFLRLFYPYYWHYSTLYALKVLAEIGRIGDRRCSEALDKLEEKRLRNGGFAAEARYYYVRSTDKRCGGQSTTFFGPTDKSKLNEFVTVEALTVLRAAGRL